MRRWDFWAIVGLAAVLRLARLDLVSITADEGLHNFFARGVSLFLTLPLAGLPSVGVRNSAFFVYLLALPNVFIRHPMTGIVVVSLLNIAAVGLVYSLTRERYGVLAARIASLLFACSPWAVIYGRNMWPPSCLGFFCLLLIRTTLRWLDRGGSRRLVGITFLGFLIPQVHFSGFCAPVWIVAALFAGRKRRPLLGPVFVGGMLGLLSWAPWLLFQHFENDWMDVRQVMTATKAKEPVETTVAKSLHYWQAQLHSAGFEYWFTRGPEDLPEYFSRPVVFVNHAAAVVLLLIMAASIVWCVVPQWQSDKLLLLLWTILPIVMLAALRPIVHPHYVLVAFPIPFVLIGGVIGSRASGSALWKQVIALGITTVIAVAHLAFLLGWYRFLDDEQNSGAERYQLSYRQRLAAVRSILADSQGRVIQLVGDFNNGAPGYYFLYLHEQDRLGFIAYPDDWTRRYWAGDAALEAYRDRPGWEVEKQWRVGPTLICLLRSTTGPREGFP